MSGPDQAEVRNEILSALSTEDFRCLSPHLQLIDPPFKKTLIVRDEPIRHVDFPDRGVASMLALLEGSGSVEVGMTGREGMVGIHAFLGANAVTQESVIQIAGAAKSRLFVPVTGALLGIGVVSR